MTKTIQEQTKKLANLFQVEGSKQEQLIHSALQEVHTQAVEETVTKLKEKGEEAVTGLWYITEDNFSSLTNKQNV